MREVLLEQQGKQVMLWIRGQQMVGKILGSGHEFARVLTPRGEAAVRLEAIDAITILPEREA